MQNNNFSSYIINVNGKSFKLVTRTGIESNESIYYKNIRVSFIDKVKDRLHQFTIDNDDYNISVNKENNVEELTVNNQTCEYEFFEIRLSKIKKFTLTLALFIMVLILFFLKTILNSEYVVQFYFLYVIASGYFVYYLIREYRFYYPRIK